MKQGLTYFAACFASTLFYYLLGQPLVCHCIGARYSYEVTDKQGNLITCPCEKEQMASA